MRSLCTGATWYITIHEYHSARPLELRPNLQHRPNSPPNIVGTSPERRPKLARPNIASTNSRGGGKAREGDSTGTHGGHTGAPVSLVQALQPPHCTDRLRARCSLQIPGAYCGVAGEGCTAFVAWGGEGEPERHGGGDTWDLDSPGDVPRMHAAAVPACCIVVGTHSAEWRGGEGQGSSHRIVGNNTRWFVVWHDYRVCVFLQIAQCPLHMSLPHRRLPLPHHTACAYCATQ